VLLQRDCTAIDFEQNAALIAGSGINERGGDLYGAGDVAVVLIVRMGIEQRHFYLCPGSLFEPLIPISMSIPINHRGWSERVEPFSERALHIPMPCTLPRKTGPAARPLI
jgi:hypothetical protein